MAKCPKCKEVMKKKNDIYFCPKCHSKFRAKIKDDDNNIVKKKKKNTHEKQEVINKNKVPPLRKKKIADDEREISPNKKKNSYKKIGTIDIVLGVATVLFLISMGILGYMYFQSKNVPTKESQEEKYIRYMQYNGALVNGETVIGAIKEFKDDIIAISVQNTPEPQDVVAGYDNQHTGKFWYLKPGLVSSDKYTSKQTDKAIKKASSPENEEYIDPKGTYYGIINKDSNGTILGISFFRVEDDQWTDQNQWK